MHEGGNRMKIKFNQKEKKMLLEILHTCLSKLSYQMNDPDATDFRVEFETRKQALKKLLNSVEQSGDPGDSCT